LFEGNKSVFEETIRSFTKINELKNTIKKCEEALANIKDFDDNKHGTIIQDLNTANEQFNILNGYNIEADTEKILLGLGFTETQIHLPINTFSGGWRMRVELAKILLQRPDLLLLDEPTNHLDIESIQWLEEFLVKYPGAVLVVSHDRTFLDNVTNRTVEINFGKLYDYNVPYSEYIIKRDERIALQKAGYENQQKYIEQNEKFIERFRYKATKAKQVQSRIKMLDKLDTIEVDDIDNSSIFFKFPPAPHSGKVVVEAENLSKHYDSKRVLNKIDFLIDKGDKIAFVGKNGEGKTTLARIIVNELSFEGYLKTGHNVKIGYYAQNETELLDPQKTVFQTIDDVAVGEIRTKIRSILGSFLFGGDTVEKKVSVLSGGEKSRLALAKLLLAPINLLILDEPTNHLDMKAKDILKKALIAYDGTLIIVSHDRHFLQDLTNKVFEFKNNKIRQYNGDVFDFLKSRRIETLNDLEIKERTHKTVKIDEDISQNKINREKRKENERKLRKTQSLIQKVEDEMAAIEKRMSEINIILQNPSPESNPEEYNALFLEYSNLQTKSDNFLGEWTKLHQELEIIETQSQE